MSKKVVELTVEEVKEIIGKIFEEKMLVLANDPDAFLTLNQGINKRIEEQKKEVKGGERGESLSNVTASLGINASFELHNIRILERV